jgi:hypothetical protein
VAAERELRLDLLFERGQAKLLQALRLLSRELLVAKSP